MKPLRKEIQQWVDDKEARGEDNITAADLLHSNKRVRLTAQWVKLNYNDSIKAYIKSRSTGGSLAISPRDLEELKVKRKG